MEVDEPEKICGESRLRDNMLGHISLNNEAHFKSQQLNEPDLTISEKRQIAEEILEKSPGCFLSRFGKYLKEHHLEYFSTLACNDYEVNYHINSLKQNFKQMNKKSLIRNRRLEALRRLTNEGKYFSDDEMRKRNPSMYEHLVGQYLTEEEKQQTLADRLSESQGFTNFLLNAIDEKEIKERLQNEPENEEESDSDTDDYNENIQVINGGLWGEYYPEENGSSKKQAQPEVLSDQEKARLMNEFRSHMYSDFLGGKDEEFDYSKVDTNHDYDDLDMLEIDQQDKYFDSETPEILSKGDESSDSSCLEFLPPKNLNQKMAELGK